MMAIKKSYIGADTLIMYGGLQNEMSFSDEPDLFEVSFIKSKYSAKNALKIAFVVLTHHFFLLYNRLKST